MPELVPTWERLVDLTGPDETAARMLTLWDPPRFLPGCSQAVLDSPPALVRNYDYSPDLFERVVYSSSFTGRRVIGMGDCLWGLLDGMNEDGLVASLAFGGRRGSASGFGIPLVVRYVLEVADSVSSAVAALERVPVSMTYNITLVDARGDAATAFVSLAAHRWLRRRASRRITGAIHLRIRRTRRGSTASSGSGSSATCSSGGPLPTRSSRRSCARRSTAPTTRAPSAPSTRRCIARPKVPSITCGRPRPGIARSTILTRPSPYDWGSRDDTGWARRDVDTESGKHASRRRRGTGSPLRCAGVR